MKRTILKATLGLLSMASIALAGWVYSAYLVNSTGITSSQNFVLNINTTPNASGINKLSAQAVYSSTTVSAASFNDGTAATGTITITNPTNLVGVKSTATVTVGSNILPNQASVTINKTPVYNGQSWFVGNKSSNTAVSIAQAINQQTPFIGFTASTTAATTVTITCAATGTNCNGETVTVNTSSLTTSGTFSGGRANAVLTINGVPLTQGNQWSAVSTTTGTAQSISNAIQASSTLSAIIASTWTSAGVVTATSTATGIATNYSWTSSNPTNATVSNTGLFGGTNSAYQANSGTIRIPSHGMPTGYGVVFSTGSNVTIGPLVWGTTYYTIAVDANDIELATSLVNAAAGTFITLTTQVTTGPHTFTLTPQAISGTGGFAWQASNDCVNYFNLGVTSVTFATPYAAGSANWDFGNVNYTCYQAAVTAPATGAMALKIKMNGK